MNRVVELQLRRWCLMAFVDGEE